MEKNSAYSRHIIAMQAKPRDRQQNLYEVQLLFLCDSSQPLMRLSQAIDWSHFDKTFGSLYSDVKVVLQNPRV